MASSIQSDLLRTLRSQRRRKRLSQTRLGQLLKMPQSHLARIESGGTDVRLSTLTEIARALDLEPMLVPKHLIPAVRYMIAAPQQPSLPPPKLVGNAPEEAGQDEEPEHQEHEY
jgi:transcriptional regulator with XRE-family HTH domain